MATSEQAIFTNMCMIYDQYGHVLVQDRVNPNWPGITFPGGHVEKGESFTDSVIREVWEETGLTIQAPILSGIKQFQTKQDQRYIVLMYKTNQFKGELVSSEEGEVFWIPRAELLNYQLAPDFEQMVKVIETNHLSELYYFEEENQSKLSLF
ncbi:8-oxo-dGTP diphosphatase [Amphibacillus sediminis]|uniref:8-oxo-dGTP diphosphatase n=1 Tax=Amphibacillus sediminis TaxID=360185 RepID=UPI000836AAAF|nr:8-oxo-dGTP diphosphatase [Amphibacillus sediminis]